jgi:hypothetical protein
MFITKLIHRSLIHRSYTNCRLYSCDQKPKFDEIKKDFADINNNLEVINHNIKLCFYFSIINLFASVFI